MVLGRQASRRVRWNMLRSFTTFSVWPLLLILLTFTAAPAAERPKIIVGGDHDNPPYEFLKDGKPTGFNVDLMRAVAEAEGVTVEFRLGPWAKVRSELEKGKIDALAGMYYSEERSKLIDFSVPHTMVSAGLFVRKDSLIRSIDDMKGKEIIVQKGDVIDDYLREKGITSRIIEVKDPADVLRLLASGRHDCALMPSRFQGEYLLKVLGISNVRVTSANLPQFRYCFAVKKGNSSLKYRLDEGLNILKVNGKYQKIYDKWFGVYELSRLWRTVRYFVWALGLIAGLLAASSIWSWFLRREVRKKTAELRESEENFRVLAETSPAAVCVYQGEYIIYCNAAMTRLTGYTEREIMEMRFWEWIHEEYRESVRERGLARQRGETVSSRYEIKFKTKEGEEKWLLLSAGRIDYKGKPAGIVTMFDITDRMRVEEALRRAYDELEKRVEERTAELRRAKELLEEEISVRNRTERVITARLRLLEFAATHSLDELLEASIDEAEALTGSSIGFFHFLEADQETLSLQNWSTRTKRELEGKGLHYDVSAAGVWVDCIRERRPVIHNDYASLPHRKGLPPDLADVVRELVLPVFRGDHIVAIIGVGNKPHDYTSEDIEAVSFLADLAWEITERKRAEEALRLSQFCIDKAGIGIYQSDETGAIFSVNEYACKSLGYTREELCSLTVFDIDPEITPERMLELKEVLDEKGSVTHHTTHRRRDGATFPVEITANNLDFQGKRYGISFVKDITKRKRIEEELLLSHFCIDNAAIGIFQISLDDGKIIRVNDSACRSLGYSSDELRTMSLLDIDPSLTWEKFVDLKRRVDQSVSMAFKTIHRRKDGTTFPVEVTVNNLVFQDKTYGISFFKDITERREAEEKLRESESRVRRKLESILDPEGDIGELDLADIIDAPQIQALMDDLYRNTGIKMSIIDLKGRVLVDVGWQEICLKYHRGHPETLKKCLESDTLMTEGIPPGEFRTYRCKNNIWHIVTPIFVGGRHMGNLFMGQFFFENEELDYDLFRAQARQYGFPEEEYIAALETVPRLSEECVDKGKAFFLRLIDMFSKLSYGNIKLARLLAERDRLTATLRESEARLKLAMDLAKLGAWEYDVGTGLFTFDDQFYALYGTTAEREGGPLMSAEVYARKFVPPEESAVVAKGIEEVRVNSHFQLEHRIIRADGEERFIVVRGEAIFDQEGRFVKIRGANQDITERKRAEEELRENRAKYQAIVDNFEGLIYICSQDYRVEFMNRKLIERTGYDATGQFCYRMMHDRDSVCPWCVNDRVFAGETLHWEMFSPKDNHWYYVVNVPIPHSDGTMSKQSMMLDITDRKLAEEELRKANMVVENSPVVLFRCKAAPGWPVELVSKNVVQFGYTPEEFLSGELTYSSIVYPRDLVKLIAETEDYSATGKGKWFLEYRIVTKEGDIRWIVDETVCERNEEGEITYYEGVIIDVTERRKAEEQLILQKMQLRDLNRTLEERVQQEVAKNREKDIILIQQNRQAALGELFDHIAHQWKQPLNSIAVIIQALGSTCAYEQVTSEYIVETVDSVMDMVRHMAQTIDVFRNFYRPDKEKSVFLVKDSIDKALSFVTPVLWRHGIEVNVDADPELSAFGYPKEYAQVLLNLLGNAKDALIERRIKDPRINIKAFADGEYAVVTIADNAGGVPDTNIEHIFDLYFTTKESSGGTGIGLYMSKNIIEKNMGGKLTVSNINDGAQFSIELGKS